MYMCWQPCPKSYYAHACVYLLSSYTHTHTYITHTHTHTHTCTHTHTHTSYTHTHTHTHTSYTHTHTHTSYTHTHHTHTHTHTYIIHTRTCTCAHTQLTNRQGYKDLLGTRGPCWIQCSLEPVLHYHTNPLHHFRITCASSQGQAGRSKTIG